MTHEMSMNGNERQELLRRTAREFVERTCPLDRRLEIEREGGHSASIWNSLIEMQWTGILVPEEFGGAGGDVADAVSIYEEMGRALLPSPHLSSCVMAARIIESLGTVEQKRRYLTDIAMGTLVVVPAIGDRDEWGEDLRDSVAARRDGNFNLNGVKQFVADAEQAHTLLVAAIMESSDGPTLFLVDAKANGVSMRPMSGWTSQPLSEVRLSDVVVEPSAMLGTIGGGWAGIQPSVEIATLLVCAYTVGAAERVYERTIDYAHHRVQFGQSISRFQRVQDHVISQRNHIDSARLAMQQALVALANDSSDKGLWIAVAKSLASEGFYQVCESAHHVHAGIGSTRDYGLYLYTKAAHGLYHYLGSPSYHEEQVGLTLAGAG